MLWTEENQTVYWMQCSWMLIVSNEHSQFLRIGPFNLWGQCHVIKAWINPSTARKRYALRQSFLCLIKLFNFFSSLGTGSSLSCGEYLEQPERVKRSWRSVWLSAGALEQVRGMVALELHPAYWRRSLCAHQTRKCYWGGYAFFHLCCLLYFCLFVFYKESNPPTANV